MQTYDKCTGSFVSRGDINAYLVLLLVAPLTQSIKECRTRQLYGLARQKIHEQMPLPDPRSKHTDRRWMELCQS